MDYSQFIKYKIIPHGFIVLFLIGIFIYSKKRVTDVKKPYWHILLNKLSAFWRRRLGKSSQRLKEHSFDFSIDLVDSNRRLLKEIIKLRRTETILSSKEERLRLLIQGIRDYGIFMLTPEGVISTWNNGAERLLGYRAEEVLGEHYSILFVSEEVLSERPRAELIIAKHEGRYEEVGWRLRKNGSRYQANVIITSLYSEDGALAGYAHVMRDVSSRIKTDKDLREAVQKEKQLSRLQRQMLNLLINELRESLSAVALSTGIQGRLKKNHVMQTFSPNRHSSTQLVHNINEIIVNVTILENLHSGKIKITPAKVDLVKCCNNIIKETRLSLPEGPKIQFTQPKISYLVMADEKILNRIISNMLSNACQNSQPDQSVCITLEHDENFTFLSVLYFGPSIEKEEQKLVYKPFSKADISENTKVAGLGLAVAEKLASLHNGSLKGRSIDGSGSTFTLTLPNSS